MNSLNSLYHAEMAYKPVKNILLYPVENPKEEGHS